MHGDENGRRKGTAKRVVKGKENTAKPTQKGGKVHWIRRFERAYQSNDGYALSHVLLLYIFFYISSFIHLFLYFFFFTILLLYDSSKNDLDFLKSKTFGCFIRHVFPLHSAACFKRCNTLAHRGMTICKFHNQRMR